MARDLFQEQVGWTLGDFLLSALELILTSCQGFHFVQKNMKWAEKRG
jgi:hypothetical protein